MERVARLEAIGNEAELEIGKYTRTEQELQSRIQALHESEIQHLARIEEAKAHLRAREAEVAAQAA